MFDVNVTGHRPRTVGAAEQGVRSDAQPLDGASHDPVEPHRGGGTEARRVNGVGGARPGDQAGDQPAVLWQPRQQPGDGAAEGDLPQPGATDQHPAVNMGGLPGQVDLRQVDGRSARPRGRGPPGRRPRRCARPGNRRCGGRRRPRRRGTGGVVRPGAGDYHAGQHCHRGNSGDRPHPPRWPGQPPNSTTSSDGTAHPRPHRKRRHAQYWARPCRRRRLAIVQKRGTRGQRPPARRSLPSALGTCPEPLPASPACPLTTVGTRRDTEP